MLEAHTPLTVNVYIIKFKTMKLKDC